MEVPLRELVAFLPKGGDECAFEHRLQKIKSKLRKIDAPNKAMEELHDKIRVRLESLAIRMELFASAYGSVKGKSAIMNAAAHVGNRHFYQTDIRNAYGSTDVLRLAQVLHRIDESLGSPYEIFSFLKTFCTAKTGGLAQGAPASPILFNIYCAVEIDPYIRALCVGFTYYTRYLDDLVLSSARPFPAVFRKRIREIVENAGFDINHRKSKLLDLARSPVTITGAVITRQDLLRPPDAFLKRTADLLHLPAADMDQQAAQVFAGTLSHLRSFRLQRGTWRISPEITSMERRGRRKLAQLQELRRLTKPPNSLPSTKQSLGRHFIEFVRNKSVIEEVAARYLRMEKHGADFVALCPFHNERTPSFKVSPQKRIYHCFGCGVTGDVFSLVEHMEGITFKPAVMLVARSYNLLEDQKP